MAEPNGKRTKKTASTKKTAKVSSKGGAADSVSTSQKSSDNWCQDYDVLNLLPHLENLTRYPLAAALVAGQALNRFGFHAQQAMFLTGNHKEEAQKLVTALRRLARGLAPPESRDELANNIGKYPQSCLDYLGTESQLDAYEDKQRELRLLWQSTGDVDIGDFRQDVLATTRIVLAHVRTVLVDQFNGEARLAFRLGELLDQGICPDDVYRHLGPDEVPAPTDTSNLAFGGHRGEEQLITLATLECSPGDVSPASSWLGDVQHLWQGELRLSIPMPQPQPVAIGEMSPRQRCEFVRELACQALTALIALARSRMPRLKARERVKILSKETREVILDGTTYFIANQKAYDIWCLVYKHRDRVVPLSELRKLPGCKGRFDKFLKPPGLPTELRATIPGVKGPGGGLQFRFPPKNP